MQLDECKRDSEVTALKHAGNSGALQIVS